MGEMQGIPKQVDALLSPDLGCPVGHFW